MSTPEGSQLLEYHGKPMAPSPINTNMAVLAHDLQRGNPMVAQLEPGDGTHYCLLIVPAWADGVCEHLGRYGIREAHANKYLIVTKLGDHDGETCYALDDGVEEWDLQGIKNGWSRQVLAWWLTLLWAEIKDARAGIHGFSY